MPVFLFTRATWRPLQLGPVKHPLLQFGINVSRVLNPYFSIRANLALGKLRGNDSACSDPAWRCQRNYNFNTPVTEFSALMVWNLFGNNSNELGRRFSPYLFAGAGVSWLNISRDYSRLNKACFGSSSKEQLGLVIDSIKSLAGSIPVIPVGAGIQYYFSPSISLTAETNFRYAFTDYLDGFSYGANPRQKDAYHSHTLGMIYRCGNASGGKNGVGCPVVKF